MHSLPKHLHQISGIYYFIQKVPVDLQPSFHAKWLKRSLRSSSLKSAIVVASGLHGKVVSAFALLRSGMLTDDQALSVVHSIFPPKVKPVNAAPVLFNDVVRLYLKEHEPSWTPKTLGEFAKLLSNIEALVGNKPMPSYERENCIKCRDALLSKKLAPKTVNKYMSLLSSLFKWAVRHSYCQANPAEALMLERPTHADEERMPYTGADIARLMAGLSPSLEEPWRWLIPLIAMHSGMRREEIAQLRPSDIVLVDNVWCFNVTGEGGRKLKTESSRRKVPIHSVLLGIGFVEWALSGRLDANLWGFKLSSGQYGKLYGNTYSKYQRAILGSGQLKCFHSFRHTVATVLKSQDVPEVKIAELLGHKNESLTTGRYGKRYSPGKLVEVVELLQYDLPIPLPALGRAMAA